MRRRCRVFLSSANDYVEREGLGKDLLLCKKGVCERWNGTHVRARVPLEIMFPAKSPIAIPALKRLDLRMTPQMRLEVIRPILWEAFPAFRIRANNSCILPFDPDRLLPLNLEIFLGEMHFPNHCSAR
jgi:hypothetical protein